MPVRQWNPVATGPGVAPSPPRKSVRHTVEAAVLTTDWPIIRRFYARYIPVNRGRSVIATAASTAPPISGQPRSGRPAHSRPALGSDTEPGRWMQAAGSVQPPCPVISIAVSSPTGPCGWVSPIGVHIAVLGGVRHRRHPNPLRPYASVHPFGQCPHRRTRCRRLLPLLPDPAPRCPRLRACEPGERSPAPARCLDGQGPCRDGSDRSPRPMNKPAGAPSGYCSNARTISGSSFVTPFAVQVSMVESV